MAYISGKYTSATEYTITLGGMSIGTVYAILVQDLNSDGSSNGFVCKWKSGATSSTHTVKYTTSSTYSRYDRRIGFFQGSFNTGVGTVVSDSNFNKWADGEGVIKAWGGGGGGSPTYTTYGLNLRTGTGINSYSVRYLGSKGSSYNTATVSNPSASTVCWTRANTNLEVTSISYSDSYGSPFYFKEYTDSTFSTVKKTFADNDDQVYSGGTRYVKLFGTYKQPAQYSINLRTGTGVNNYSVKYTLANGNTQTATVSNPSASTVCWVKANTNLQVTGVNYSENYAAPFRFKEYDSSFSTLWGTFSDNDAYVTASQNRYLKLNGTYYEPKYTAYLKCGTGIKHFSVYRNGTYVSMNQSTSYTPVELTESKKSVTIKNINPKDSYGAPYYLAFFASSTATSPSSQLQSNQGEFTYDYASNRQYGAVTATKIKVPVDPFYWDNKNGSSDGNLIATGKPFSNLTAEMWNRLNKKIKEISEAQNIAYTYTTVNSGSTMTATLFNQARNGIAKLPGRGTIPSEKTKGDTAMAGHFNGVNSIKNGLNTAIQSYNA